MFMQLSLCGSGQCYGSGPGWAAVITGRVSVTIYNFQLCNNVDLKSDCGNDYWDL